MMSSSSTASAGKHAGKKYPPPDSSKSYSEVPRRHIPPKGLIGRIWSNLQIEFGLNMMEPMEKVFAVIIYALLLVIVCGVPFYIFLQLYRFFI